jgi:hypothetical protein
MNKEIPTKQQLAWAGRVWDEMLLQDREGTCLIAFGYVSGPVADFAWKDQGAANQLEITRNLLRVEQYFIKARR